MTSHHEETLCGVPRTRSLAIPSSRTPDADGLFVVDRPADPTATSRSRRTCSCRRSTDSSPAHSGVPDEPLWIPRMFLPGWRPIRESQPEPTSAMPHPAYVQEPRCAAAGRSSGVKRLEMGDDAVLDVVPARARPWIGRATESSGIVLAKASMARNRASSVPPMQRAQSLPAATVSRPRRTRWLLRVVAAMLIGSSLTAAPTTLRAEASSTIIDSYIDVTSVVLNSDRTITVDFDVKRAIPSSGPMSFRLCWMYASAARNSSERSSKNLVGLAAGSYTRTLTGVPATIMTLRVMFKLTLPSVNEDRTSIRLVSPGLQTHSHLVSSAEAAGNALVKNLFGAYLTFAPQGRAVRFAGALLWGWQVFSDVKESQTGVTDTCPHLTAGQYMILTEWRTTNALDVQYRVRARVWSSKPSYSAGDSPLCNVSWIAATYR